MLLLTPLGLVATRWVSDSAGLHILSHFIFSLCHIQEDSLCIFLYSEWGECEQAVNVPVRLILGGWANQRQARGIPV